MSSETPKEKRAFRLETKREEGRKGAISGRSNRPFGIQMSSEPMTELVLFDLVREKKGQNVCERVKEGRRDVST